MTKSDDHLVVLAIGGDETALSQLLERRGPEIRLQLNISAKWRSLIDPDDVMQVTYLEAFLRIKEFRPTSSNGFSRWLARIARDDLRDAIRGLGRKKRPQNRIQSLAEDDSFTALLEQLGGTATSPSGAFGRREIKQIIDNALNRLPPLYAKVLRLCELEGRPDAEVAQTLGRSQGAVRMLVSRARDRLREVLGPGSAFFTDMS